MMPLDIYLKGEGLKSYIRTKKFKYVKWDGKSPTRQERGHRSVWESLVQDSGMLNQPADQIVSKRIMDKIYSVDYDSFKDGTVIDRARNEIFTDGSKLRDKTGYGHVLMSGERVIYSKSYYLGEQASVFQAEVSAITEACSTYLEYRNKVDYVHIYSDCQSALQAIDAAFTTSNIVLQCHDMLNSLANTIPVRLHYVKAHVGILRNEHADAAAKLGTEMEVEGPEPFIGLPVSRFKGIVNEMLLKKWQDRWESTEGIHYQQTRHWFPSIDVAMSKRLINLSRSRLGVLTQVFTGHNFLKRHQNVIDCYVDPTCRLCEEEDESVEHIVGFCKALFVERLFLWEDPFEVVPPIMGWDLHRLISFLFKKNHIFRLFDPNLE